MEKKKVKKKKVRYHNNSPDYWFSVLGEDIVNALIKQAHIDAKNFHKLVEAEKRSQNASRNKLARSASAAT